MQYFLFALPFAASFINCFGAQLAAPHTPIDAVSHTMNKHRFHYQLLANDQVPPEFSFGPQFYPARNLQAIRVLLANPSYRYAQQRALEEANDKLIRYKSYRGYILDFDYFLVTAELKWGVQRRSHDKD